MKTFQNQVALITGGSSGIGYACAELLLSQGATVILFSSNPDRGKLALDKLCSTFSDAQAVFFPVDVSDFESVQQQVDSCLKQFGKIDILINSAGITQDNLLLKMREEEWDRVMAVNAKSIFNTCKAIIKGMMQQRFGRIINLSSVIALNGNIGQANYAASKAAIIAFSKSLAKEVARRGITVNAVAPGFTQSNMTQRFNELQLKEIIDRIPQKRMASAEEVASSILFLASKQAGYITGHTLVIDGGMSL